MSAGVFAYGSPPFPEAPPRSFPTMSGTFAPVSVVPCAKCARHVHVGTMCPFCYADSLKPEAAAEKAELAHLRDNLEDIRRACDDAIARVDELIKGAR